MSARLNPFPSFLRNPGSRLDPSWRRALLNPAVSLMITLLVAQLVAALVLAGNTIRSNIDHAPLLALSSEQITRILIRSADEHVELAHAAEGWVLPALADFPADADKVDQLLSRLMALQRPLPVGASSETQQRLKVADDNAERRIRLLGDAGELAQILLGDSSGFRRLYARLAGEEAVYDLPLANVQITSDSDDWVRHDQLWLDAEAILRISYHGHHDWTLSRQHGDWQLTTKSGPSVGLAKLAKAASPLALDQNQQTETDRDPPQPSLSELEPSELESDKLETDELQPSELDPAKAETLVRRIAKLSYRGVRMPAALANPMRDHHAASADADDTFATSSPNAATDLSNGTAAAATLEATSTAIELRSEPLLQLEIGIQGGDSLIRRVFADPNGGYLLQTDSDPQLYALSEYDLDGLIDLELEQLMVQRAAEPTEKASAPEAGSGDNSAAINTEDQSEVQPKAQTAPHSRSDSEADHPSESAAPQTATAEDQGTPSPEVAAPASEIATPDSEMTTPEPSVGMPGPEVAIPDSEAPREPATNAATEPVDQPEFRPRQPPAQPPTQLPVPPQWPYQRYAPPNRQPWPPGSSSQSPAQGSPPQTAPTWR
ncbi:MAG: DUF4340 domain-containing protein [Lamprobacter sp.]|uniref:DUF4340 domain-containing protein n=1 Tax=Lamprobacter sp. TaxID=3100796 RepID=UPI002B260637|nr:DUF4340 domain-containing protein [Lamprobacter sp.]MEA3640167.1 DUF4340 domain-containing protein [Lamprobacter sp.]